MSCLSYYHGPGGPIIYSWVIDDHHVLRDQIRTIRDYFGTRHKKKIAYDCRSDSNLNSYVLHLTWLIPILVEVDSVEVARLVNDSDRCWAEEGFLVDEINSFESL